MSYVYFLALFLFGSIALFSFLVFAVILGVIEFIHENIIPLSAMAAAYILVRWLGL